MNSYPHNRIYAIIPITKTNPATRERKHLARKSIDQNLIIWDFDKNDKKLKKLKKQTDIKLLTHAEALKEVAQTTWAKKDLNPIPKADKLSQK